MKIRRNCIFGNARINQTGSTADWGAELGQSSINGFLMMVSECSEILNGLLFNIQKDQNKFNYGGQIPNAEVDVVSIFTDVSLSIHDPENNKSENVALKNPTICGSFT